MPRQAEANVGSQNLLVSTSRKEISWCNKARLRGASTSRARAKVWAQFPGAGPRAWGFGGRRLGPGPMLERPGAWGPGPTGAWGRASQGLGAQLHPTCDQFFVVLKSLLVGGWRRGGSQLNNYDETRSEHGPVGNTWLCYILVTIDYATYL